MSANATDNPKSGSSSTLPETTASELIGGVGAAQSFDAQSILRRNPRAAEERSTVVDLAYEEYCRKKDAGESLDIHDFAGRFPDIQQSLIRVLEVHEYLEQNPDSTFAEFVPQWPELGDEFLGFSLIAELGRGAFSRVFLAEETELGNRQVVVKVCEYANGEPARLGQLEHSNIMPVHSVQTQVPGGLTVICMPFLATATLQDVLEDAFRDGQQPVRGSLLLATAERTSRLLAPPVEGGKAPWVMRRGSYGDAVIELGAQICDALQCAHGKGILHCDVKPSNVLLTAKGQSKLFDFNLSRQHSGDEQTIGGTLPYMAPEQVQCLIDAKIDLDPPFDQRTDLFSLGVTLFQLLTGKLPFEIEERTESKKRDARELLAKQRAGAVSVAELERVVDPATTRLILSCIAFDPEARPSSAESLARHLRSRLSTPARAKRWIRSHRILTATAMMLVLAVATIFGYYLATRPSLADREFTAGIVSMQEGRYEQAITQFDAAIDAGYDPADAGNMKHWVRELLADREFWRAVDSFEQGEYFMAIAHAKTAIEAGYDPIDKAYLVRGWSQWLAAGSNGVNERERTNLRKKAYEDFDESYGASRSDEAALSLAFCEMQPEKGKYGNALAGFRGRDEESFRTPGILNDFAICVFRQGLKKRESEKKDAIAEAIALLEKAIAEAPDEQVLHYNLAAIEFAESKNSNAEDGAEHVRHAVAHIEEARRVGPPLLEVEYRAACIYATATLICKPALKEDYLNRAIASCEAALKEGLPVDLLDKVAECSQPRDSLGKPSELEKDERFARLRSGESASKREVRFLIPMDISGDIIQRVVAGG